MKFFASSLLWTFLFANQAFAIDLCDTQSSASIRECVIRQTGHIREANLENEYLVVTTNQAKKDLLLIASHFDQRTDKYAKEVQSKKSIIRSAKALVLLAQFQDEPNFYYFAVSAEGILTELFNYGVIDFKDMFPRVADRATFRLHSEAAGKAVRESIDWSYEEL